MLTTILIKLGSILMTFYHECKLGLGCQIIPICNYSIPGQPSWDNVRGITIWAASLPMHTSTRNSSNGPVSLFCSFWSPFQHGKHLFRVSYVCAEWHHLLCLNELFWNSCNSPFFVQDYNSISFFFRCNMLKTFCSGLNCFMRSLPYNKFLSILILL